MNCAYFRGQCNQCTCIDHAVHAYAGALARGLLCAQPRPAAVPSPCLAPGPHLKHLFPSLLCCPRVLPRLFPTRVKLAPPPSGQSALRHQQRMARDAMEAAVEENYRAARATALSAG